MTERGFLLAEPTPAQTREILEGLVPSLEEHHGGRIAPEAIVAAVDLTVRYVPGRRLPDKAIDALDQCGARLRLETFAQKKSEDAPKPEVGSESVTITVSQWTGAHRYTVDQIVHISAITALAARRAPELKKEGTIRKSVLERREG